MITKPYLVVLLAITLYSITPPVEAANGCLGDSVPEGSQSEVTCIFDRDIKQDKLSYTIWKFPLNSTDLDIKTGTKVLSCSWGQADLPDCVTERGYKHTTNYAGCDCQVSLKIPSLTKDQEGIYQCKLATQNDVPSKTCKITIDNPAVHDKVPGHHDIGTVKPSAGGVCPSLTCPDSSSTQGIPIAGLVFVLAVLIILVIFVFVYIRLHYRLEKKPGDPAHDRCGFCGFTLTLARQSDAQAAPSVASTTAHASKVTSKDVTDNVDETKRLIEEAEEATETAEDSHPAPHAPASSEDIENSRTTDETGRKAGASGGGNRKELVGSTNNQPTRTDNRSEQPRGGGDDGNKNRQRKSTEDKRATRNQREGTQHVESGPSVSPPGLQSENRTGEVKAEPQQLQDDQCDMWTVNQVCQWLTQEGLGIHVKCFTRNKVDGKRLLTFTYMTGLSYFVGMGSGPDGKDRGRLIAKIERLRRQVAKRKEREESERKERERKNQNK